MSGSAMRMGDMPPALRARVEAAMAVRGKGAAGWDVRRHPRPGKAERA